jgi:hypothetical protein
VAKIMDARSFAMLAVWLRSPEPDLLARVRKIVSGGTVGEASGFVGDEHRRDRMADQPVSSVVQFSAKVGFENSLVGGPFISFCRG